MNNSKPNGVPPMNSTDSPESRKSLAELRKHVAALVQHVRPQAHVIVAMLTTNDDEQFFEFLDSMRPSRELAEAIEAAQAWLSGEQDAGSLVVLLGVAVGCNLTTELLARRSAPPPSPMRVACGSVSEKGHVCTGVRDHLGMHFNQITGHAWA